MWTKTVCFDVDPSPSYIDFQNAKNRLNNVRIRLIDEILWFWPKSLDIALEQEVVDYLKDKNYDGAISYWNTQSMTDSLNTTSIHNLAILHHSKSLDLFINENSSEFLNDLELEKTFFEFFLFIKYNIWFCTIFFSFSNRHKIKILNEFYKW